MDSLVWGAAGILLLAFVSVVACGDPMGLWTSRPRKARVSPSPSTFAMGGSESKPTKATLSAALAGAPVPAAGAPAAGGGGAAPAAAKKEYRNFVEAGASSRPGVVTASRRAPTASSHHRRAPTHCADLAPFKGEGGGSIYLAADGLVFDVSSNEMGRSFYGPGGGYSGFAGRCVSPFPPGRRPPGCRLLPSPHAPAPASSVPPPTRRDATIGLATMETNPTLWTKKTVEELSVAEVDVLSNWVTRFRAKYAVVGTLTDGARPTTVADARAAGWLA